MGLSSGLSAQEAGPDELTCVQLGVQGQQTTPEARQLYRQAARTLDEVALDEGPPGSVEPGKLARSYWKAAELDAPCSAERVQAYRTAARLLAPGRLS